MRTVKRVIGFLILTLILVVGVLFSIENKTTVPLNLIVVQLSEQRVALWVLSAFAAGGLLGVGISLYAIVHLKGQALMLRRRLERCNKELGRLRAQSQRLPAGKS